MDTLEKKDSGIGETFKTVFWALILAGLFRTLFFQPFYIPSGSMKDTLLIGDFMFVNKMAYGYSRVSCPFGICPISGRILASMPERGDVVVFRVKSSNQDFVKRLVGLPGDKIQMINGLLHINGTAVTVTPDGQFIEENKAQRGNPPRCIDRHANPCVKDKFIETLPGGVSHSILNIDNTSVDNTGIFTVKPDHFFFVGDNRDNSGDSRAHVGQVHFDQLIGRADRIIFSSAGNSLFTFWKWRSDRFFKAVE